MHRFAHILSIVLITAGVVVLSDAGATLLWQEPMSAAYGALKQAQAEEDLAKLKDEFPTADDLAQLEGVEGSAARASILAGLFSQRVHQGQGIGRMHIDRMNLDIVLVQGTDTASLQKGPGHYEKTAFPGQGSTIGVAGHRTTYLAPFRHINDLEAGDQIRLEMPYGVFTYTVMRHEIVDPSDVQIVKPVGFEELVMTACHPVYSAAQRYAVFSKLTRIDTFSIGGTGAWVAP